MAQYIDMPHSIAGLYKSAFIMPANWYRVEIFLKFGLLIMEKNLCC